MENVPKASCLEKIRKVFFWEEILEKSSSPVVRNPEFYQKSGAQARLFCRSSESSNVFTGKHP